MTRTRPPSPSLSLTRREAIGTLTAAALLGGCSEGESKPGPRVEMLREQFYREDVTGVRGIVKNVSNRQLEYVSVLVKFYGTDGSRLSVGSASTNRLPTGRTFRFDILYTGSADASNVDHYKLTTSTSLGFTDS